jgi:hypothetical protein
MQHVEEVEAKPKRKIAIPANEKMHTVQELAMILKYSDKDSTISRYSRGVTQS